MGDAIQNHYDDGVPLRYAWQYLTGDAEFQAEFEDKLFETVKIPSKPGDSFVVIQAFEEDVLTFAGPREFIGKVAARIDATCIKKYPTGQGSEMDFRAIMKTLRRCLCGKQGVEITMPDGEKIGEVDSSLYLGKIPLRTHKDGNFDVLHKGISVLIAYR